jgi:hypothetical protein
MVDHGGVSHYVAGVLTGYKAAYVQITFRDMKAHPPFDDEGKRQEFRRRLNEIDGVSIPASSLAIYPSFQLRLLKSETALKRFLGVLSWAVGEIRGHSQPLP